MKNSFAYVSTTVGRLSIKKTALLTSLSRYMFRGNSDACVSVTVEILRTKKIALLTSLRLIVYKGNRSAYVRIADRGLHSLHSQMASAFITYSYQINFESVLMIHDHEGMLNMFKALEASGLRKFLGCESILYEKELGDFFDTALIQGEDITGVISGKFVTISPTLFSTVFDLPTEGITNFSEVPKDKVYDARSLFSQKGLQIDVHGKKKFMNHEFRLLNDILAKAITVKACSFDSVTVERFQMMTVVQCGLKVNWGKVLFNVLKDMVDRTQKKAKGFAAQIGVLLKGIPAIPMGDGVPFPSAKVLSMRTVHTYIVTNTTIDARTESEEPGMAKTPKAMKKLSSVDEMPVDMFAEFTASEKRSATEADAPIITKKRRTGKSKPSVSQAKLDIVQVATDVEPIQIVDPTHVAGTVPSLVLKRKSRKRKLVLSRDSDDESVGTEEISKEADVAVAISTVEADIAKVLEETLALGVTETEREKTNTLAIAVRRQLYVLTKYRELLLRTVLESYQRYLTPALPWNAMAVQVANLLSVAHSNSIEELKAQQQDLNIELVQSHSSLPAMDYIDSGDVRLAHFYSIANSSCWVRPVLLIDGVWTPVQGPEFWSSSCNLSLFLDNLQMPGPAIQEIFVPHISFIAPDQYWATVPWLMRIWRWTKVCEEIVQFNVAGGLRPVRKDVCHEITVSNLGVERIPANFLRFFARGLASQNFVDSVVEKDLGDIEEVVLTGVEEVDLVSSDVSTVYRSPSPPSPGVDSLEHDLRFALGPAIFSHVEQEERLYFFQNPDSPPAVSPHHESSSSSTDVSLHFDSTDVPVHAQAATHAPASVDFTKLAEILEDLQSSLAQHVPAHAQAATHAPASVDFTKLAEILEDLQSSLAKRIHDSNCEMLSKLNSVELGVRGDLLKMQSLLRQYFETACRVLERQNVPVHAQAATHASASVDSTKLAEILEDLQSSLSQRIHDSNCEMLSKLNSVELGVRGDLLKMQSLLRQSFETTCRVLERQSNTHTAQITDLKKGLMGPVGIIFGDLFEIKKKQREQVAKQQSMDEQIAAIRNEHLEFQSKIAADMLSLSTQVGDIADFLRSGVAKKGEMGSSSRPTTVRAQTQTLPPTTGTFEERVAQARRNIIETGQVISIEEAAARVIENDRRESERLEREKRDPFRKQLAQHDIVCLNGFDDVSHRRTPDILTSPSFLATTISTDTMTDTASHGPTTIVTPKSQFRTCPSDHGKAPRNIAP
ncbi:dystroglycan-like [Dorcoceras hygrometricum]|uniref:Dystroglycan-like n=1 Tax=Dorcoceras hygrometricum TaxID=472368 RepID=A0A2Z7CK36_9LAMI|nr:dystroglycan-like [Dorcoceras hygrometricum]